MAAEDEQVVEPDVARQTGSSSSGQDFTGTGVKAAVQKVDSSSLDRHAVKGDQESVNAAARLTGDKGTLRKKRVVEMTIYEAEI